MKWMPASVGAEPKKLIILGVLVVVLGVVYWTNSSPDLPPGAVATPPQSTAKSTAKTTSASERNAAAAASKTTVAPRPAPARRTTRNGSDDFTPSLKVAEDFDLSTVDPTLKLDRLAKVRAVGEVGGKRSLFEYYTPPPPPPPKVAAINPQDAAAAKAPEQPQKAASTGPPKPPPPPPPAFKFFGYEGRPGDPMRRAFFVEGEDNYLVAEGDLVRDRYKVIRIGVTSVEVEDTVSKTRHTLQIVPQADQ